MKFYQEYIELSISEYRIKRIDGSKSIEEVHQHIIRELSNLKN